MEKYENYFEGFNKNVHGVEWQEGVNVDAADEMIEKYTGKEFLTRDERAEVIERRNDLLATGIDGPEVRRAITKLTEILEKPVEQ